MKSQIMLVLSLMLMSFGLTGDGLIENVYPQLIGNFRFIKTVADKGEKPASDYTKNYTVTINTKDQILFFENGKRKEKMHFVETKMPFLDDQNHVFFGKNNEFEPMFYRGDTIVIQSFPIAYQENYFIKVR